MYLDALYGGRKIFDTDKMFSHADKNIFHGEEMFSHTDKNISHTEETFSHTAETGVFNKLCQ
jgi:hypothetical protein